MASLSSLRKRPRVTRIDSNPDASGDVGNASPAPSDFGQVPRGHGNGSRHRRHWKQIYAERLMVERNWRQGQYRTQTLDGHSDGVLCLQFDDQYLITGSYDNTVKVWNLQSGSLIRTLEGHRMGIRALQFDQAKLITGSMDGTLRIWNYRTGTCMRTMTVSGGGVNCLHFDSSLLAAGCVDGSISVWDFYSGSTLRLVGHADWVNGVQIVSPNRLLSCSDDTTIRLWDLDTRTCIREYHGHVGHVQSFQLAPVLWKVSATGALTQPTGQALQHINYPEPSSSSAT
ncbi:ubiquitin-binding SDF ubiquitin ligase complex subunit met30, partial [Dimargaris verticillata]